MNYRAEDLLTFTVCNGTLRFIYCVTFRKPGSSFFFIATLERAQRYGEYFGYRVFLPVKLHHTTTNMNHH